MGWNGWITFIDFDQGFLRLTKLNIKNTSWVWFSSFDIGSLHQKNCRVTAFGPPTAKIFDITDLKVGKNSSVDPLGCSKVQPPPKAVTNKINKQTLAGQQVLDCVDDRKGLGMDKNRMRDMDNLIYRSWSDFDLSYLFFFFMYDKIQIEAISKLI